MTQFTIAEDEHITVAYKAVRSGRSRYFADAIASSSAPDVASCAVVNDFLEVTAVAEGSCSITVTGDADPSAGYKALSGSFDVVVTPALGNAITFETVEVQPKNDVAPFIVEAVAAPVAEPAPVEVVAPVVEPEAPTVAPEPVAAPVAETAPDAAAPDAAPVA